MQGQMRKNWRLQPPLLHYARPWHALHMRVLKATLIEMDAEGTQRLDPALEFGSATVPYMEDAQEAESQGAGVPAAQARQMCISSRSLSRYGGYNRHQHTHA